MLLRVLISIILLAVYLPGVYGDEEIDYSAISDSSNSNDISEANSSEIVDEVVANYIEEYEDALNWGISSLVDSFTGCFDGFPD